MNGQEFYQLLSEFYQAKNQNIYDDNQFVRWLPKNDGTSNFQSKFPSELNETYNIKSIPKRWLVEAKNDKNIGEEINRNWFNLQFNETNSNDCIASVAMWLLNNH